MAIESSMQQDLVTLDMNCRHDMDCSDHIKGSYCSLDMICECSPFYVMFNETVCLPCELIEPRHFLPSFMFHRLIQQQTKFIQISQVGSNIYIPQVFQEQKRLERQTEENVGTSWNIFWCRFNISKLFFQLNFWEAIA